jgi:hypothetical protein
MTFADWDKNLETFLELKQEWEFSVLDQIFSITSVLGLPYFET